MNGDETGRLSDPISRAVEGLFTDNWWVIALRGLLAILFGIAAFVWPHITLLTLIYLFGFYALLNGILSFVMAVHAPRGCPRFGSLILTGICSLAAGIIAFIVPGITAWALIVLISAWAIINGITEIVSAVRLRKVINNEWWLILAGFVSVAFGVIFFLRPVAGALVLLWWIGTFAIIFGILLIAFSFRVKRWDRHVTFRPTT